MPQAAFADLYHASYQKLAAQISAYLGDPAEAEDVVQEAYLRTWQRWSSISRYDDPPAYLRRIAWNLATSRWRKLTTAARHLRGQRPAEVQGGPQPDHVAMVAALRQLPDAQRRAIVLHHIADLPVDAIAGELNAPRGTVLSWLHRGRERLAMLLDDAEIEVKAPMVPPLKGVHDRLKRRRRTRALTLAIGFLATSAAAVAAFLPTVDLPPPTVDTIYDVNWSHAALELPDGRGQCPSGRHVVQPDDSGLGMVPATQNSQTLYIEGRLARFGDLTGDGSPEAVVPVWCSFAGGGQQAESRFGGQLLVVTMRPDHTLAGLAYVGPHNGHYHSVEVTGGQIVTQVQYTTETSFSADTPAHMRTYRWDGTRFVQTAGRTEPLILTHAKLGLGSPVRLAEVRGPDGAVVCPARTIQFDLERDLMPGPAVLTDLDRDGNEEVVVQIRCGTADSIFLLTQGADAFETSQVIFDGTREISPEGWELAGNTLTLKLADGQTLTLKVSLS